MSTPHTNEIGTLIDESALTLGRVWVVVLCGLVVLLDGYDIQTMSLAVPSLTEEWALAPSAFSLALSASVLGMLIGAALLGPFGDKLGRRPFLIWGMTIVGIASLATALATTPEQLVAWRLLTGVGLGTSLPNATALTSEYVPRRTRAFSISAMFISIALGALIAGFTAPALIDAFGWRSIFVVGGALPLLVALLLFACVPESLQLLVTHRPDDPRIPVLARRYLPKIDPATIFARLEDRVERQSVAALFAPRFWARTCLLWVVFALNLFVLFVLISWLPTILTEAGWTRAQALRGAVVIQAGGIFGGLVISRLVDRGRTVPAMAGGYIIVAVCFAVFLIAPPSLPNWTVLLLLIGGGVSGSQAALTALSAIFYPSGLRATGAGWASMSGRAGAAVAPIAGGIALSHLDLGPAQYLALLIPPVLLCGVCVLALPYVWREARN